MTTPTEREALIARLRSFLPDWDESSDWHQDAKKAADMLAADHKEIASLRAEVDLYISACDRRDAAGAQQVAVPQETSHGIAHSLGGFRGGFHCQFGRMPTEQEIWNHAIRSWRDLHPAAPQPPQAERVPMTDAEIEVLCDPYCDWRHQINSFIEFARAIEAHHGIGAKP